MSKFNPDNNLSIKKTALLILLAIVVISGCSKIKPEADTPLNPKSAIHKSFFGDLRPLGVKSNNIGTKTFLCGWMADRRGGKFEGWVFDHYNLAGHCNVIFEITKNELIGRQVNPSKLDDPGSFDPIISIPIVRHYSIEKKKDQYGRETNQIIYNSSKDHWSVLPYMELNFKGTRINDWSRDLLTSGYKVDNVDDVEWDQERNFLGFTLRVQDGYFGSKMHARYRFNFLEFNHDKSFKRTPFTHENSKHLNILHVIGEKVNRVTPNMYAAHWDTRETSTIYLNNFPDEYKDLGELTIKLWNDKFKKIGHERPFKVAHRKAKYDFDLRYPSITWVADKDLSNGPLGVAMASTDVRNGKIIWGGVTIWAGMLQFLVNHYSSVSSISSKTVNSISGKPMVQLSLMESKKLLEDIEHEKFPNGLTKNVAYDSVKKKVEEIFNSGERKKIELLKNEYLKSIANIEKQISPVGKKRIEENNRIKLLTADYEKRIKNTKLLHQNYESIEILVDGYLEEISKFQRAEKRALNSDKSFNADYLQKLINQPTLSQSIGRIPLFKNEFDSISSSSDINSKDIIELIRKGQQKRIDRLHNVQCVFDLDRTLSDVVPQIAESIQKGQNKFQALRTYILDTLLHEVGHMLGLGHNFKENILPERGSVPDKYLDGVKGLVASAKDGFKNYTSVMGYKNGSVDVTMKLSDLKPGPYDEQVLQYLYNRKLPFIPDNLENVKDRKNLDFKYLSIDEYTGLIDEKREHEGKNYKLAYFPACNDAEASMGADPYCARFDKGYDAKTIVENYFDEFEKNLTSTLYNFTGKIKGGAFWSYESYLWSRSLRTFGRTRMFYDYMRLKYKKVIDELTYNQGSKGVKDLINFSKACLDKGEKGYDSKFIASDALKKMFLNSELKNLCKANNIMIDRMKNLLSLPGSDHTKVDFFNKHVTASMYGGNAEGSFSKAYGSWIELAKTPIKISALLTLTSPYPFSTYYGWVYPIQGYSGADERFSISTLYPEQYSEIITETVNWNLTVGNNELDRRTKFGKAVNSLGYFLRNSYGSNDALDSDTDLINEIRKQTEFRYSVAIIEVKKNDDKGDSRAKSFTGTIHNMYGRGPEKVQEIYPYEKNKVILMPPPGSLLYPLNEIRWFTKTEGYFYAIKMDYSDSKYYDYLKIRGVRHFLSDSYGQTMERCIVGEDNGIRALFKHPNFKGIEFPETIANGSSDDKTIYFRSLDDWYDKYYNDNWFDKTPMRSTCQHALRGQGLFVMAASVMNGFYLPGMSDFFEKGF